MFVFKIKEERGLLYICARTGQLWIPIGVSVLSWSTGPFSVLFPVRSMTLSDDFFFYLGHWQPCPLGSMAPYSISYNISKVGSPLDSEGGTMNKPYNYYFDIEW